MTDNIAIITANGKIVKTIKPLSDRAKANLDNRVQVIRDTYPKATVECEIVEAEYNATWTPGNPIGWTVKTGAFAGTFIA